jgi:phospholipid/cholesterol/gamma-HCH transport system substrate-binding protein
MSPPPAQAPSGLRYGARVASAGSLVLAAVVLVLVLTGGGARYEVHARFADAGQLVEGNEVVVGGERVGSVERIRLSDDNLADLTLKIADKRFVPLHAGTRASISAVGLAGIANRFVELTPGSPHAPKLASGAVLSQERTTGIVDIDQLLDAIDPGTRRSIRELIRGGATALRGVSPDANRALLLLNPALGQSTALADEVLRDRVAFERLIAESAQVVGAVSRRRADLEGGIDATAAVFDDLARRRAELRSVIEGSASVLTQATGTLTRARRATTALRPTLRALGPVAPQLARVLRVGVPAGRALEPVLTQARALLEPARRTLLSLPPLARSGIPAFTAARQAIDGAGHVFSGLRAYSPDVIGIFNSFGGTVVGTYDANGHVVRAYTPLGQTNLPVLPSLLGVPPLALPTLDGLRTGLTSRCPGGAAEPARDRSNPYIPDASLCRPGDDHRG